MVNQQSEYQIGDLVNITCWSGPSWPPAKLSWFVNGEEVPSDYVKRQSISSVDISSDVKTSQTTVHQSPSLQNSSLSLEFYAQSYHFKDGMMRIRCNDVVTQTSSVASEKVIVENNIVGKGTYLHSEHEEDAPIITGGKSRYEINDVVNLTCTSTKAKPAPELSWFINEKELSSFSTTQSIN
ncbi:hypothetical protein B4U79_18236 [Dinothrombium tinctorium]|uniref:Ig-like domain-containing protein n=1 Tax=Dinothrombium tinctorium TaxID=1965070 RepID=A0A3S4QRV9_9ACAR|nr:hypothetical protein B4U79_18378 [Dinothrombium tinctorium]RWS04261.1 hypothetical protein B4U79_18375 [Dinothrombium tinctorium]RWS06943.1 hypothetical protein B4U79_18236 [Dinothrombium tinctorium]